MSAPPTAARPAQEPGTWELPACDGLDSRQFQLAVKRLADSLNFGAEKSPYLGSGQEYVQSRPYQPGDPVRAIDWRVLARTGKPYVKEYEAPRRMPAWMLVDTSASMTVSSTPLSKYAWAVQIAGGLAFACLDRGSPAGVLGVGERDLRREPAMSRDRVMQWLHQLRRYRCTERTTLGFRLSRLIPSLPHRALLVVLSDLHDPGAIPVLRLAVQRHDVVVIQLQDPAEEPMRGTGFFRAREAETGAAFLSQGRRASFDFEGLDRSLRRSGIDHLRLRTDQPILAPLRRFVQGRGVLTRQAR